MQLKYYDELKVPTSDKHFSLESVTKEKSFKTPTPVVNVSKLFFSFLTDEEAK
jgi:hypothetical protein